MNINRILEIAIKNDIVDNLFYRIVQYKKERLTTYRINVLSDKISDKFDDLEYKIEYLNIERKSDVLYPKVLECNFAIRDSNENLLKIDLVYSTDYRVSNIKIQFNDNDDELLFEDHSFLEKEDLIGKIDLSEYEFDEKFIAYLISEIIELEDNQIDYFN